jgi:flagellar biosynthesis/type III secretory pathway protein FliH
LAKILQNVKKELEEEKKRSHNLTIKLEQSLSDKEQYRLKFDNLRKKLKDDAIVKDPLNLVN